MHRKLEFTEDDTEKESDLTKKNYSFFFNFFYNTAFYNINVLTIVK